MRVIKCVIVLSFCLLASPVLAQAVSCQGSSISTIPGLRNGKILPDGSVVGFAKMNINIDGYGRAYHAQNASAGALIHLCNAGEVFLPSGVRYHGSIDNATCTGRFMQDFARIQAAGWNDSSVGAIRWYGILGKGEARIHGRSVRGVKPVVQSDGAGFYVSPTSFADTTIADAAVQERYINPLRTAAAVIPANVTLRQNGVTMGSFGVAMDRNKRIAVPFVVGDGGPRIGEGTPALARSVSGLEITDAVTHGNRYAGQIDNPTVLWVFFGHNVAAARYDHQDQQALVRQAQEAFSRWGGLARLEKCL